MSARRQSRARLAATSALALALGALVGCGEGEVTYDPYVDHHPGVIREGMSVDDATGCDTSVVSGLTVQLVAELNCISPNSMVDFSGSDTTLTGAVQPYLAPSASSALHAATAAMGESIKITSAYRSVAQQYLLYKWYQAGLCGIQVAATPGNSNHQSGRAIDTPDYSHWNSALTNEGWHWLGSSDVVHFDFLSAPDIRHDSVLAFQRLWNKNNPGALLVEDGAWGPNTEGAMKQSPATGFPISGCSATTTTSASTSGTSGTSGTTGAHSSSTSTGTHSSSTGSATTGTVGASSTSGGAGSTGSGSAGASSTGGGTTGAPGEAKAGGCHCGPGEAGAGADAALLALTGALLERQSQRRRRTSRRQR